SNPPPPPWQGGALPNELFPHMLFSRLGRLLLYIPGTAVSIPIFGKNKIYRLYAKNIPQNEICACILDVLSA
ncbi:MAG: hypothetical protein IIZ56_04680, partial [Clostridia bacterium]|nr:hypothetical protein [Clostridia bacterium]